MTRPKSNKNSPLSFDAWMAQLNQRLSSLIGFDTNDLCDQECYGWWEDGYSINDAISELAVEEGFEELLGE